MITTRAVAVLCTALLIAQEPYVLAQQAQSATGSQDQPQKTLTPAQLDSLVAPIALYPDPILSQVLVASTYPLEIVEAGRWLNEHSNLKTKELADAAAKQPWDASVQALVVLPDVLKRLDQNVSWTSDLGNTFLAQEADVMDAVQRLRKRARDAGALQSTKEQTVSTATEGNQTYVEIQPASTDVVYVPQYNPVSVWGPPPEYYPYPAMYYPPPSGGAIFAASAISFGVGMAVGAIWSGGGWGGWGWGCGWGHNNVVINNNFIRSNHFNHVNVANGNAWVHNPAHRGGVPYTNRNVANRYRGAGSSVATRPTVSQTQRSLNQANLGQRGGAAVNRPGQGKLGQGAASRGPVPGNRGAGSAARMSPGNINPRPSGVPAQGSANRIAPGNAGQHIGNRNMGGGFANRGAFGDMHQGGNRARMNSNRGFASHGGGRGSRGGGRRR
jgi:hypothetical protein